MNAMLEPRMVAAKIHGPFTAGGWEHRFLRITGFVAGRPRNSGHSSIFHRIAQRRVPEGTSDSDPDRSDGPWSLRSWCCPEPPTPGCLENIRRRERGTQPGFHLLVARRLGPGLGTRAQRGDEQGAEI